MLKALVLHGVFHVLKEYFLFKILSYRNQFRKSGSKDLLRSQEFKCYVTCIVFVSPLDEENYYLQ